MPRLTGTQRMLEVAMILTSALALFMLLSLLTFHESDASWSQSGAYHEIHNAAGSMGAKCADLLFTWFGHIAFAFPFFAAVVGWFLFQKTRHVLDLDYLTISLRLIGTLLMLIAVTSLTSLNVENLHYFSAGGVMGDVIGQSLLPYFSNAGTSLLLLCFLCTGFTLTTGVSWITVIDGIGFGCIKLLSTVYLWIKRITNKTVTHAPEMADEPIVDVAKLDDNSVADSIADSAVKKSLFSGFTRNKAIDKSTTNDVQDEAKPVLGQDITKSAPSTELVISDDLVPKQSEGVQTPDSDADEPMVSEQIPNVSSKIITPVSINDTPVTAMPSVDLLERPGQNENPITQQELDIVSRLVEDKLADFNIAANVVGVYPGPVITRFELDLAPGMKVSKISALSKDLARALSAISVRVVEVIPGKSVIGLELPNKHREIVRLSEVLNCRQFEDSGSNLTMVLGKDIGGKSVVVDLAKMPHLLVAGTTGSGKSVGVNVMILSLLYKSSPDDVRMIMIDPKMLELSVYEGIPHLLAEVVTDMKEAANALRWCVGEMERRYRLMSALGVRNLKGFNSKVEQAIADGQPIKDPLWRAEDSMAEEAPDLEKLPSIVVVVDEFADMMMIVGKKVEELIARIAQKARAAGIHLILATQRPSVDVITGLIKANIPTRIAFQVSSKIDSRTIMDQQGAEALLGMGDMLYLPPGTGVPTRVHGAFVDDHEVHAVVADWKRRGQPQYIDEILNGESAGDVLLPGEQAESEDQEMDAFYDEAVALVTESRRASVSSVQRKFRIGYNRAARIVEQMELSGVVSAPGHNGNREVIAPPPPKD